MNSKYLKAFLGFIFSGALALFIVTCGGGGDSSSTTTSTDTDTATGALSIEASVSAPTSGSALTLKNGNVKAARMVKAGRITEVAVGEGVEVHCEDTAGNEIGNACTTDSTGTCEITGLTEEQVEAGVVVVSEDEEAIEMHAYEEPEADAIEAAAAGTPIPVPVNTESDMAFAVIRGECSDDIAGCKTTVDPKCIKEAMQAIVGDDDPSADDLGGFAEAMFQAHAAAFQAGVSPADLMKAAVEGDSRGLVSVVSAVGDVSVADAATNLGTMVDTLKEAYCAKDTTTGLAPWQDVKTEAGDHFDPKAMAGIFKGFTSTEFGEFPPESFRAFGQAMPQLDGGFQMFGVHPEARRSAIEQFRLGAFNDVSKVGPALGFLASSFPPPTTVGDFRSGMVDWTGFDPKVGAQAAHNGFLEYVGSAQSFVTPSEIYAKFNATFSDATRRQAFAQGDAFGTMISAFAAAGDNISDFKADAYYDGLKSPPGGDCVTNDDCLPCDKCTKAAGTSPTGAGTCVSISTKMGASCSADSDCGPEGVLACVGGFIAALGGNCMCKAAVPTGAFVHSTGSEGPVTFGTEGGYTPPSSGAAGSSCGTGLPPCKSGHICSAIDFGICLPGGFKYGPYAPCATNGECESGTCSGGFCAAFTATQVTNFNSTGSVTTSTTGTSDIGNIGNKAAGQSCTASSECASFYCSAGVCNAPPTMFQAATTTATQSLKADGATCTYMGECQSGFCGGSPLTCQAASTSGVTTGTTSGTRSGLPTNLPAGAFCMTNGECASLTCNFSMSQCK